MNTPAPGTINWIDLTVTRADKVRDFYQAVAGWTATAVDMGGYNDYGVGPPGAEAPVAGICHRRGENSSLPPQWLIYINVVDLAASLRACAECGGKVIAPEREMSGGRMAVIQDPAGAVAALFQSGEA